MSMTTGRRRSTRMFAARSARWAMPGPWSVATSRHVASSSASSTASGAARRGAPADVLEREHHRAVGQPGDSSHRRTVTPCSRAEQQQSASCSTSCSSDGDGHSSSRLAQHGRAVPAVEDVGVAAVVAVDLDEHRRAVGRRRRGTAASGRPRPAASVSSPTSSPASRSAAATAAGRRPAVRRTEDHEHRGAQRAPDGDREQQLGKPAVARDERSRATSTSDDRGRRPAPRPRQPRLADRRRGGRRRRHRRATGSASRPTRSPVERIGDAAPAIEHRVEQRATRAAAGAAASADEAEPAPPSPTTSSHDDDDRRRARRRPGRGRAASSRRSRDPARRPRRGRRAPVARAGPRAR